MFTIRPQTRDKGIGTLCGKCYTQEVFYGFDFKGKIEGSQIRVPGLCQSLTYMQIVENISHSDIEKIAKGTLTFLITFSMNHDSWLQFYHLFRVADC